MKKLLLVVLVAIFSLGTSFAQPGGGGTPEERLKRELDGLTTALSLTKDQVAKVTPILTEAQKVQADAFAKMREAGGTPDRDKMREDRAKMQAETDGKLKAVLTPDQVAKLDAFRKTQAEERAKRMQQRQ